MKCPKCQSTNVNIQIITKTTVKKGHSFLYWIFIGWWLELLLWFFFGILRLIALLMKNPKVITKEDKKAVCQNCGYSWNVVKPSAPSYNVSTLPKAPPKPQVEEKKGKFRQFISDEKNRPFIIIGFILAFILVGYFCDPSNMS